MEFHPSRLLHPHTKSPFPDSEIQLELSGRHELLVEGCGGITEYTDSKILLKANNQQLHIWGHGLEISCMTHNGLVIQGTITGLEYGN